MRSSVELFTVLARMILAVCVSAMQLDARPSRLRTHVVPAVTCLVGKNRPLARAPRPPLPPEQSIPGQQSLIPVFESLTIPQDLRVGNLLVLQHAFFDRGTPGIAKNVLLVTKGDLTGPDTFNSVKAAVDSITTASPTNRFVVLVGPGVFSEDTIVLKPYVTLIGQSQASTIIEVDDPNKDVIIGSDESFVANLAVRGATGGGYAGIRFNGPGILGVAHVELCSCDTGIYEDSSLGVAQVDIEDCLMADNGVFTFGVRVVGLVNPAYMRMLGFSWSPQNPPLGSGAAFDISGPHAAISCGSVDLGVPDLLFLGVVGGTAVRVSDGAELGMQSCALHGFACAIDAPNSGVGPRLHVSGVSCLDNAIDLRVQHPATSGSVSGVFARTKTFVDPATTISLFFIDPLNQGTVTMGPIYMGDTLATITDMSPIFQDGLPLGVMFGGALSNGAGLFAQVAAGSGYLMSSANHHLLYITWEAAIVPLAPNTDNFIYVDSTGTVHATAGAPDPLTQIELGKVRTDATSIVFRQEESRESNRPVTDIDSFLRDGLGPVYENGSLVSKNGDVGLNVSGGNYYFGTHEYFLAGGTPISWSAWCHNGPGTYSITPQSQVDYQHYDQLNTLTPLGPDKFARHALYAVGDGSDEWYELVYGQVEYDTLPEARAGTLPLPPGTWTGNIVIIASIIVKNSAVPADQIADITDERPRIGFKATSIAGVVTQHDDLSGRTNDANHPQYLLISGSRLMAGALQMGGNVITGAGQVNGVTIEAHASRHGANSVTDPLPTGAPVTIGTANLPGGANDFSRSDHVHAHGAITDNTLASHADATALLAGFMSAADKTKLDGIIPANFVLKAGDTMTGNLVMANQRQVQLQQTLGTNYVGLRAPAAIGASYILTFPAAVGAINRVLKTTDASGTLGWDTAALNNGNTIGAALTLGTNDAQPLNLETNNTIHLAIDPVGNTTYSTNYTAAAYLGRDQRVGLGDTIVFDQTVFDPGRSYDVGSGIYRAPYPGRYLVTATVGFYPPTRTGYRSIQLRKDGEPIPGYGAQKWAAVVGLNRYDTFTFTGIVELKDGQRLDVYFTGAEAGDLVLMDYSSLHIHFMSTI